MQDVNMIREHSGTNDFSIPVEKPSRKAGKVVDDELY
jgi:hypothetical protein